jgi:hypothetical protein
MEIIIVIVGSVLLFGVLALYFYKKYSDSLNLIRIEEERVKQTGKLLFQQEHASRLMDISIQNLNNTLNFKGNEGFKSHFMGIF